MRTRDTRDSKERLTGGDVEIDTRSKSFFWALYRVGTPLVVATSGGPPGHARHRLRRLRRPRLAHRDTSSPLMEVFISAVDATKAQAKSLTAPSVSSHHLLPDDNSDAEWPKHLIKETSASKQRWDLGLMLCIIYSALVVPFRISFHAEAEGLLWVFEASMSLIFMADLVLSFNTAFLLEGNWVTSKREIAKRYLSGWFWIDAPSSVPVELIELTEKFMMHSSGHNSSMLSAFRILRMLRLVRILRLLKLGEYISRMEEQIDMSLRGLKIVQLMLEIVFIAHLLACSWFATTWLHGMHNPGEATWIDVYEGGDAADGPVPQQYLYSFYWALTVLSAQNPIPPTTDSERIFMVGVSLLNRLLFAYIVGKISTLIAALDRQSALVTDKMDVIKEYLYWRSTPRELAIRIKRYYEFYYQKQAVFDENAILNGLSPSLHSELVASICKDTLGKIPLFAKLSPEFQAHIFPLVKPLSFNRGDVIYASGSASDDLLFLIDGSVDMLSEVDGTTPARRFYQEEEVCSLTRRHRTSAQHAIAHPRLRVCALLTVASICSLRTGPSFERWRGARARRRRRLLWPGSPRRHAATQHSGRAHWC